MQWTLVFYAFYKPSVDTFFPEKLTKNCSSRFNKHIELQSFNKQSLFTESLVKKNKRIESNTDNVVHRSFAVSDGVALLRAFRR